MQKQSFIKELFKRRVPQILGLYVAATWMMIEIGDWVTDRFQMAPHITSYIFVGMAVFLPSVCILAYQYGQPGKDPWKKSTLAIVPINLLLAVFLTTQIVQPVVATEHREIVDENGEKHRYEVSKQEHRRQLISFFWRNQSGDESLNWLQHGGPWLLAKDLDRSLFVDSYTPFSSQDMREKMKQKGFIDGVKTPNALRMQLAKDRNVDYSIIGKIDKKKGLITLSIDVIQISNLENIASLTASGENILSLIDELSDSVKRALKLPTSIAEQTNDLPVAEHVSDSIFAIENFTNAKVKRILKADFEGAKAAIEKAINADFSFAYAYTELANIERYLGNMQGSEQAISQALKHEYKFTLQEKFLFKGISYAVRGDYQSQVKVYDMWLELYPDDVQGHEAMVDILLTTGIDHKKAFKSLQKLAELNPKDMFLLKDLAKYYVLNDQLDKAANRLESFLEKKPQDIDTLYDLADIYARNTEFGKASQVLDKILLLDRSNLKASLKKIEINKKQGHLAQAFDSLILLEQSLVEQEKKHLVKQALLEYYLLRGQIRDAIRVSEELLQLSQHLPPVSRMFSIEFPKSLYLASIGQTAEALTLLNDLANKIQPPLDGILNIGVASVYLAQKDYANLQKTLDEMRAYFRQYPNPLFESAFESTLGQVDAAKGDYASAVKKFRKVLSLLSGSLINTVQQDSILNSQTYLAEMLFYSGEIEEAETLITKVLARFPSLPQANLLLAKIHHSKQEFDPMQAALSHCMKVWESADQDYLEYQKLSEFLKELNSTNI
ncbi:tetratricopeptide repeat protein [Aliikangiella sp. IMCC44653]